MTNIDIDPMIQAILRADHLRGETRIGYSKRLSLVASAAGNKALTSVDHASTKSAELDLQELHRAWHTKNHDCGCSCCIQAAGSESNKES